MLLPHAPSRAVQRERLPLIDCKSNRALLVMYDFVGATLKHWHHGPTCAGALKELVKNVDPTDEEEWF